MKLSEAKAGQIVFMQERMGNEVREVFYLREDSRECRHPHHVPIARLGFVQGDPEAKDDDGYAIPPRFVASCDPPCRDPGEADGRVEVLAIDTHAPIWWRNCAAVRSLLLERIGLTG